MIELDERLSEFSYGYGVTREVEQLLAGVGLEAVPFLPSLLQEKKVGFDVLFKKKGVPLLLQFKLGQSLNRFVRGNTSLPAPILQRPFFRFSVDTAEIDGQYETLLKAQMDGAEVYYIAPRFADWAHYIRLFEANAVLEHSVLVRPGDIRNSLVSDGSADGPHRVVYDRHSVHVCSKPREIHGLSPSDLAETMIARVRTHGRPQRDTVQRVYAGLSNRAATRRERQPNVRDNVAERIDELTGPLRVLEERQSPTLTNDERSRRLAQLVVKGASEENAIGVTIGLEFWGLGIQLVFAVERT